MGLCRKFGPFYQVPLAASSLVVNPREGRSAGLISLGQCLQESCELSDESRQYMANVLFPYSLVFNPTKCCHRVGP